MTSVPAVKIGPGDVIKGFIIKKKVGEGACGTVYLVENQKDPKIRGAMKVEPNMKSKEDEILKMEVFVLRKLQKSKHICRLMMSGKTSTFSFVIMSLLGKELSELRRRMPDRKMPLATTLRVGYQCMEGIQDMHVVGFIHRDIKPSNFACGFTHKHIIYVFDFGLSRQIMMQDKSGALRLREPRNKVCFRGTVRYCSVNVHQYKEQGRHDDIISCLYMLIELLTASLPWKGQQRRESGHLKETVADKVLLAGCPPSFEEIYAKLKKLTYNDTPPYDAFRELMKRDLVATKIKMTDPFEWEKDKRRSDERSDKQRTSKADERAEIEKMEDTDTVKDLEDSILTEGDDVDSDAKGLAKEDTLDNVADMGHT
uniref:Protein kinase domain-containing protein n=1 Tax=Panagrellus redivivus TaxID=6233 RepID=A0A7E4UMF2_PANRE